MEKTKFRAWFEEFRRCFLHYVDCWTLNQITSRAAALTYTTILSLVPAIAVCIFLFAQVAELGKIPGPILLFLLDYLPENLSNWVIRFADFSEIQKLFKKFILENLTAGSGEAVLNQLDGFVSNVDFKAIGLTGLGSVLMTSVLLLFAVENSMNGIWRAPRPKTILRRVTLYTLALIFAPLLLSVSFTLSTIVAGLFPTFLLTAQIGSFSSTALLISAGFYFFPNTKITLKSALVSGLVTTIAITALRNGFGYYTKKSLLYSALYGGLSVLPFFLVWLYFNWIVILAGVQLNYVLQNRRYLTRLGDHHQWHPYSVFDRERARLIVEICDSLRDQPKTLMELVNSLDMPEFAVANSVEWMLRSKWLVGRRKGLRKFLHLSEPLQKKNVEEELAKILNLSPAKACSKELVEMLE